LNNREERSIENMENQALAGVKVLDFGWAIAGAYASKHFGDYGAQVVKIESKKRPDLTRTATQISLSTARSLDDKPWFTHLNTSKYGIIINLKHDRAREVMERLIRWADVVNENYVPGTMKKLGLGYEDLKKIKPDIIMVSSSAYGQTGPLAKEPGTDAMGSSLTGHHYLTGYPDRMVYGLNFGDYMLPYFSVLAVVAALDYKRRTGKGQHIDASMFEVMCHKSTPFILDFEVNAHISTPIGNRNFYAAPHGVFPCIGDEKWCVIAVFTNEEWQAFCHVIGDPPWTKEQRFATFDLRKQNEDELEELVAGWTRKYSSTEVMRMMQEAGVAAGVVQNAQDLLDNDPQIKEREFFVSLKHPILGFFSHTRPPYKLLKTKAQVRTSPCIGEHTEYVCTQLLGMTDTEFTDLFHAGVFE
jgi:benzylsuccinate CoA-transferase BbsF subunit